MRIEDFQQNIRRRFCDFCKGATTAEVGEVYTCNSCTKKDRISIGGLHCEAIATDATGFLTVTLYDNDVLKFLNCESEASLTLSLPDQSSTNNLTTYNAETEVTLRLRAKTYEYLGVPTRKFTGSFLDVSDATVLPCTPAHAHMSPTFPDATHLSPMPSPGFRLQDALDQSDELELSSEERKLLQSIMARTIQKGAQPTLSVQHESSSKQISASKGIDDDEEWEKLMKGPAAMESSPPTTIIAKNKLNDRATPIGHIDVPVSQEISEIKQFGKDRALVDKDPSPKARLKLFE